MSDRIVGILQEADEERARQKDNPDDWWAPRPRRKGNYLLELTRVELEHILTTVFDAKREGHYWGRKDQYIKRVDRIIGKIERALSEADK